MRGIAADRLHEPGNQVGPALELDVDIGPAIVDHLPFAHEQVVEPDDPDQRDHRRRDQDVDQHRKLPPVPVIVRAQQAARRQGRQASPVFVHNPPGMRRALQRRLRRAQVWGW
jgi:hypothetical protein